MGAVSLVGIARTESYPLALLLQAVGGASGSIGMATCMAIAIDGAAPGRSGAALGWLTLGNQAGYLVGPALAAVPLRWLSVDDNLAVSGERRVEACHRARVAVAVRRGHFGLAPPPRVDDTRAGNLRRVAIGVDTHQRQAVQTLGIHAELTPKLLAFGTRLLRQQIGAASI